jgi:maltose/moltooligosaccharide transporter
MREKKRLSFWDIWNMSFGFLGIQFGFALQGSNMSRIFETLGAEKDDIPLLWIAAPLTGLIVQPIIGYLSDRTWSSRFGRRRPFFLIGAVLSSFALFFVPYSSALWMAVGFLWILDASINISMEPFRALVADKLHEDQRSYGFVIQTLIIGIGTWVASNLPWLVTELGADNNAGDGEIPQSVYIAFAVGAFVFLSSILYTVFTTSEAPPEDMEAFLKEKEETSGLANGVRAIFKNIADMPVVMRKLGLVQFFSWFAFFTMWSYATPALTEAVFNAPKPPSGVADFDVLNAAYNDAANSVSSAMGVYGLSSMAFALVLTFVAARLRINRKYTHMVSLAVGGIGFLTMALWTPETSAGLNLSFALIGVAWGSILSMPYAMLSSALPEDKMGVYMGIFNMFIVLPQIIAAVGGINYAYKVLLGDAIINTMVLAGICLILGGLTNLTIVNQKAIS